MNLKFWSSSVVVVVVVVVVVGSEQQGKVELNVMHTSHAGICLELSAAHRFHDGMSQRNLPKISLKVQSNLEEY